jgi:hypothetical protein
MKCQELQQSDLAEKYVSGQLDESRQNEFELHILECAKCLQAVEVLQALRLELNERARQIRAQATHQRRWFRWQWAAAVCSLLVVGGLGLREWHDVRPVHQPTATGRIQPPTDQNSAGPASQIASKSQPSNGRNNIDFPLVNRSAIRPAPKSGLNIEGKRGRSNVVAQIGASSHGPVTASGSSNSDQSPANPGSPHAQLLVTDSDSESADRKPSSRQEKIATTTSSEKTAQASDLLTDEGEKQLFLLSAVQPAPYDFSGSVSHPRFGTSPGPSAAKSGQVRSASEERAFFAEAMRAYVDRNYYDATDLLQRVLQTEPGAPDANFYLGVTLLLRGRPDLAFNPLKLAASGHTRWAQPAHFYLAKAHLQTRDLAAAETELKAAAGMTGNFTGSARADLASLQNLRVRENK